MLRAWLRQLRARWFASKGRGTTIRRQPRSVRLGVETLESRKLLSATVPGFTPAGTSTGVLLDSHAVTSFAVTPKGDLLILESNGALYNVGDATSGAGVRIDNQARQIAFTPKGDLLVLETNGQLYNVGDAT